MTWEYQTTTIQVGDGITLTDALNAMGDKKWELIFLEHTSFPGAQRDYYFAVFRRPKAEPVKAKAVKP